VEEVSMTFNLDQNYCHWFSDQIHGNLFLVCKHEDSIPCTPYVDRIVLGTNIVSGLPTSSNVALDPDEHVAIVESFPVRSSVPWPPVASGHKRYICTLAECYEVCDTLASAMYHTTWIHKTLPGFYDGSSPLWLSALDKWLNLTDDQLFKLRVMRFKEEPLDDVIKREAKRLKKKEEEDKEEGDPSFA